MTTAPTTWVVGAGGLLGGGLMRALERDSTPTKRSTVPWARTEDAVSALVADAHALASTGRPWRLAWTAGAGVVASSEEALETEVETFGKFLEALDRCGLRPSAFFLASSAGGLYAGSSDPPYSEDTPAHPISPYGTSKAAVESLLRDYATANDVPAVIGRISNLYGPGQNLDKPQGLIPHLCSAQLRGEEITIYVPLDTRRDYIYIDDCAKLIAHCLDRASYQTARTTIKVMSSGQATTVAQLLDEIHLLTGEKIKIALQRSPVARLQPHELSFASRVWTDLDDELVSTALRQGIRRTLEGIQKKLAN